MRWFLVLIFFAASCIFAKIACAQDSGFPLRTFTAPVSCKKSSSPLFQSDSIINLIIIADFKHLLRDRARKPENHGGKIFYFNSDSIPLYFGIKIRQRGEFRRQKENCSFPPLAINFKRNTIQGSLFQGQNKIKLVTHCRNRKAFEQNLLTEYLAYKLYNQLTDFSYKVRLAKITYIDSSGYRKPISRFGFFIETKEEFEKRNCVSFVKTKNLHQEVLDRFQMTLVTIFQYLIGNTDWSVPNRHNIDLYLANPKDQFIPVTYDFDFAGIVNAPYAQPQPMLGISKVTDRLYRGFPRDSDEINAVVDLFTAKEVVIKREVALLPFAKKVKLNETTRFLNAFFDEVNDKKMVKRIFIDGSRKLE